MEYIDACIYMLNIKGQQSPCLYKLGRTVSAKQILNFYGNDANKALQRQICMHGARVLLRMHVVW